MQKRDAAVRRETRLLFVTIAVSVLMLLVLARFRFPQAGPRTAAVIPAVAPLERLAARATYDELASIMDDLWRRVSPSVVVIALRDGQSPVAFVPAVRVDAGRAVAIVGVGGELDRKAGAPARIVARASGRDLVALDLDEPPRAGIGAPAPAATPAEPGASGPRYVAVVEAVGDDSVVRPVYVGRTDLFDDPRGSGPLLRALSAQALPAGAAVFGLDGTFIGLSIQAAGIPAIVPAAAAFSLARSASGEPMPHGDLGIEVQALTPPLAHATGATSGVVVAHVLDRDPSASLLSGDVIQSVDGTATPSVAEFQDVAETLTPGDAIKLEIVRRRGPMVVDFVVRDADGNATTALEGVRDFGAILRTVKGAGAEVVAIPHDSAAARAGLVRGDLIVALAGSRAPDSRAIRRAYDGMKTGDALLLTVQRAGEHRVIPLEKQ
jgi:S1-C subfamily serine protease